MIGLSPGVSPVVPGPPPPTEGSESPRSEASEGKASRSSRLSNPEFAAKHKAFMAKVTAATKGSMDTYLSGEIISNSSAAGNKRKIGPRTGDEQSAKRRRSTRTNSSGIDVQSDGYCWLCHKEGEFICCEGCPRVFHHKCLQLDASPADDWMCPECVLVMAAENMETRSRAMRLLTIDQLCTLLKHALTRIKSVSNVDPFLKPVDPIQFPAYKDYISCPMDLQSMERNIRRKQYGSTEAMLADCKWILHNCIVFNAPSSKLTSIAKSIVNVCKHEMQEIENCPDCYLNAHVKKEVWFTEACRLPHPLVWAKLKGFPYWPAKVMRVNQRNEADIRFFGVHDRAWIPIKDVYLFSQKPPLDIKKKRGNIDDSFAEVEKHLKKLRDRFGRFEYAGHRTNYEHTQEGTMLGILFPDYKLPFDLCIVKRRKRSLSHSGSEKSRNATPTPVEAEKLVNTDCQPKSETAAVTFENDIEAKAPDGQEQPLVDRLTEGSNNSAAKEEHGLSGLPQRDDTAAPDEEVGTKEAEEKSPPHVQNKLLIKLGPKKPEEASQRLEPDSFVLPDEEDAQPVTEEESNISKETSESTRKLIDHAEPTSRVDPPSSELDIEADVGTQADEHPSASPKVDDGDTIVVEAGVDPALDNDKAEGEEVQNEEPAPNNDDDESDPAQEAASPIALELEDGETHPPGEFSIILNRYLSILLIH